MDTERTCLELLLRRVRFTDIELEEKEKEVSYCRIDEKKFLKIAKTVLNRYSGDELIQIYKWLNQKLERTDPEGRSGGIFTYISEIAGQFLEMKDGRFLCRTYASEEKTLHNLQLLRWRELSVSMGNEIFIASLLAENGVGTNPPKDWLCTPFPTFDEQLKTAAAMENMAENHFHLKGSIPVFTLNWVCLMNHIGDTNKAFFQNFDRYLEPELVYEESQPKHSRLIESSRQAAFYRMYLYHRLNENQVFLDSAIFRTMKWEEEKLSELQAQINVCRAEHERIAGPEGGIECLDYAAGDVWMAVGGEDEMAVAGERYFLYRCFKAVFQNKFTYREKNLFYRYLVICLRVRAELVQVNGKRGFSNFAEYQDRKEDFIEEYPCYQKQIMKLAVKSPGRLQSLSSMELRITPKNRIETMERIAQYDRSMGDCDLDYFYVLHYPKRKDTAFKELRPRNYQIRDYLDRQIGEELALMRKELTDCHYHGTVPRVRGFDTCSGEIGCRPEVFGQFYRRLQAYNRQEGVEQAHFTYHVGEDFLDIFSGLRAVDEAVRFCCLPRHSRIGHGMVLGIDAERYYQLKKNCSVLDKQEILDNTAWILGFCREHGIVIDRGVDEELRGRFSQYFGEIYGYPEPFKLSDETQEAQRQAAAAKAENTLEYLNYYNAWKLRGDRPEAYWLEESGGYADSPEDCRLLEEAGLEDIRKLEVCRKYYRDYHFAAEVRENGNRVDLWHVDDRYYQLVTRIQEELRLGLTEKEIAVECNPSSNYLIGPFYRYEEHPMLRMYGKNLAAHTSSRMNVSINTDDQGVFHTTLEMEHAVMYTALSKSRDEQGQPKYSEECIRQWLSDVNEFGRRQAFHFPKEHGR